MTAKAPLQQVNDRFGSKEKLVDELVGMLDRGDESKDEFRDRLLSAANAKLLRLHATTSEVKERFGSKEKLVEALLGLMNRQRDQDYKAKLMRFAPVRLLPMYREWQRKNAKRS